jgi:hypothetical protein
MNTTKFDEIIESYINGNISWVKAEVKKLSKAKRKELHQHCAANYSTDSAAFFFELI